MAFSASGILGFKPKLLDAEIRLIIAPLNV